MEKDKKDELNKLLTEYIKETPLFEIQDYFAVLMEQEAKRLDKIKSKGYAQSFEDFSEYLKEF